MPKQRLSETLSKLHQELAAEPTLDSETTDQLKTVLADIEGLLAASEAEGHESLVERLSEATSDFETSHPRLSAAVAQLADALSGMGL